ncbi:MAG: molybdopterin converting factor [Phototrophicales bacterium]|nr:MAG: molybdopterin converting factor [Phototrophicales bacterium]
MAQFKVRLFATLKDLAGQAHIIVDHDNIKTIDDIRSQIRLQYPPLAAAIDSAIAAVNQEYVFEGHIVSPSDEIAFFPPVSGGSENTWAEIYLIAKEPISLDDLTAQIVRPETGAVAIFSGYVRGKTQQQGKIQTTTYLEYEAYEPMAIEKMKQVAAEIRQRWPLVQGIAIVQRVGTLQVGQPTVLIACAAGHRDQGCFEAARYGIDRLKEIVPVWKKEVQSEQQHWVEGHYRPTPKDTAT